MEAKKLLERYAAGHRSFRRADLKEADLERATLAGVDLSNAELFAARLIGADLSGATLVKASLLVAKLGGANLERALEGQDSRRGLVGPDRVG